MVTRGINHTQFKSRAASFFCALVALHFDAPLKEENAAKRTASIAREHGRVQRSLRRWTLWVCLALVFAGWPMRGNAQTFMEFVLVAPGPQAMTVNPVTNKIYVVSSVSNVGPGKMTVIDGFTDTVIATIAISAGNNPFAVAVNPVTNKIYAVNSNDNTVTVVDGVTNTVTATVSTDVQPDCIAINPLTNMIYVGNQNNATGTITVIDGATNSAISVPAAGGGSGVSNVEVNTVTNKIYAVSSTVVTVIDGATNNTTPVTVPQVSEGLAVNPVTNKIYVGNAIFANVTVIDGATNSTSSVGAGSGTSNSPNLFAVNPVTNKIYVINGGTASLVVIDGATNSTTTLPVGNTFISAMALNPVTNQIYLTGADNVLVIDGATNGMTTVSQNTAGDNGSPAMIVNPVTDRIYVADTNFGTSVVTVIDGATNTTATVSTASGPNAVAVNPVTNQIYFPDIGGTTVTVINGLTNLTTPVTVGTSPAALDINVVTNQIYVANSGSSNVSVINGATNTVTATVSVGTNPQAVAVNPVTNKVYVANFGSGNVIVIDGVTNTVTGTVGVGTNPQALAINPVTNRIYVANNGSSNVTVIDGATNTTSTVTAGTNPDSVAVNPVTNKIYVSNAGGGVTVIDGATNTPSTVTAGGEPIAVAVNPVTNKIYVANRTTTNVTVINGATNATTAVAAGTSPQAVAVNSATNEIYVANVGSSNITVIDGATNAPATVTVTAGSTPFAVGVNPVTNEIYVANSSGDFVTVISEELVQAVSLTTTITPLPGGVTGSSLPTFTFTAVTAFSPNAPAIENVYFQLDTIKGPWIAATPGGGNFTGTPASALQFGTHIVYAFASDGQDANSGGGANGTIPGGVDQELAGLISAMVFTVTPPPGTTTAVAPSINPAVLGQSVTFTATVTSTSPGTPTGTVTFFDGATELGTGTLNASAMATFTTSSLALGSHSITGVYGGDSNFTGSTSVAFTENINNPVPVITPPLSPASAIAGTGAFTLTVNGSNFETGATATFGGTSRTAIVVNSGQVTISVLATDIATAGTPAVVVTNPGPGGGASNSINFTVNNPVPVITPPLSPTGVVAGSGAFTLTVNGTGFVNGATVSFGGVNRVTTFVNPTQVTAAILAGDVTSVGTPAVVVTNPVPGGGASNSVNFSISAAPNPVPVITPPLSPASAIAGTAGFTLTINGTNFVTGAVVSFGGTNKVTTFVNATQVTAAILAGDIAVAGSSAVVVTNPGPGGGPSNSVNFAVNNPVPVITPPLSPAGAIAGSAGFTLTINGTGFINGSVVSIGGANRATTFVSGTQVTAAILAADIATAGTPAVIVTNSVPGGGASNSVNFTVSNAVPVITPPLVPSSVAINSGAFTLTVNGTGFVNGSVVSFGGANRVTTFVSATKVTAAILATDLAAVGTPAVVVTNPAPGGGASNSVVLNVVNPVPVVTPPLVPASVASNSGAFTLTVNGTGFISGAVVSFGGANRVTTFVSGTQLTAAILATDVTAVSTPAVVVTNPGPGGGASNSVNFSVVAPNPVPVITPPLLPATATAGSAAFTLTVNGTGFVNGASVSFGGANRNTTFVSATQVTAAILASDVITPGTPAVVVTNPAPGGGASNSVNFTITDFSVSNTSGAKTVTAGQAAMYTINASGVGGNFPGTVTFSATGLPTATTAGFVPPTVAPGAGTAPTTLTLTTTARTNAKSPFFSNVVPHGLRPILLWTLAAIMLLMSLLILLRTSRMKGAATFGLVSLLFLGVIGVAGCNSMNAQTGTPAGTYTVTVTATSGSASHSTTVSLTVD
jgi:YVTN family beta-propeller protein